MTVSSALNKITNAPQGLALICLANNPVVQTQKHYQLWKYVLTYSVQAMNRYNCEARLFG